jgi:hypothetical protein
VENIGGVLDRCQFCQVCQYSPLPIQSTLVALIEPPNFDFSVLGTTFIVPIIQIPNRLAEHCDPTWLPH